MRFIRFNPANGESRTYCLSYIKLIDSNGSQGITIYPLDLEPYNFNIDYDDFVAKVFSDTGSEDVLIDIDEPEDGEKENPEDGGDGPIGDDVLSNW